MSTDVGVQVPPRALDVTTPGGPRTNASQHQSLQLRLDQQQAQAHARIAELEAQIAALTDARRGAFDDDEHDPEGVTLSSQWSMLAGLLDTVRQDQQRVEAAQRRIEQGTFGICAVCGGHIPVAQLEVRPWREQCVVCSP